MPVLKRKKGPLTDESRLDLAHWIVAKWFFNVINISIVKNFFKLPQNPSKQRRKRFRRLRSEHVWNGVVSFDETCFLLSSNKRLCSGYIMTTKRYETDRNYLTCWHFCCSLTTRMRQRSTWYRGILIEQLTKQAIQDVRLIWSIF